MALILQIVLGIVVLVGLITIAMSAKSWHWAQMVLLLGIFFFSIGTLILGLEVVRIHQGAMTNYAQAKERKEQVEKSLDALQYGTRDNALISQVFSGEVPFDTGEEGGMPSLAAWNHRLQVLARDRGRVWRNVQRAGNVDASTNQVPVSIAGDGPLGLDPNSIVYAFEMGPPNGAAPEQGGQYLGAFRVVNIANQTAVLESLHPLNDRTGNRLQGSQRPWSLYETMPGDRHELFAGMNDEQKQAWLPGASVEEYLRHGGQPTPDDDQYHRALYDESDRRLGPESAAAATPGTVQERYRRPLRNYAYLFEELARKRAVMEAKQLSLKNDIAQLEAANANAQQLTAVKQQELSDLRFDLGQIEAEQSAISAHLAALQAQVQTAENLLDAKIAENLRLVAQLTTQAIP